jgi:hypothetical protein
VVARWDEARGRGEPIPLDGVDVTRPAEDGVLQRVVRSLVAYWHSSNQRWVGAQVTARLELLTDPDVTVFPSATSNVTGRAVGVARKVGDRKTTVRDAGPQSSVT